MRTGGSRGRVSGFELPTRPRSARLLLGVCAGLSRRFDVDVTLLRLAFIVLTFAWGIGALLYVVLWLLTPNDDGALPASMGDTVRRNLRAAPLDVARSRRRIREAWGRTESKAWPRPTDRRWIAFSLIALGAGIVLTTLGLFSWITPLRALGLSAVVVGVAMLFTMRVP